MGLSHAQVKPKHTKPWAPGKKPLQPQGIITKMAANKGRPDMPKSTPVKKSSMIMVVALCAAVGSGCSMFSWMGGRSKDKDASERYDDAPITRETGTIPGDRTNAEYSGEELTGE